MVRKCHSCYGDSKRYYTDQRELAFKQFSSTGGYYVDVTEDGWNKSTVFHVCAMTMFLVAQMPPFGQLLGLCLPMRPNKFASGPKTRRLETLRICLVTKGTNVPTAVNSARCWDNLPQRHNPSVKFQVLVDSENSEEIKKQVPSYPILIVRRKLAQITKLAWLRMAEYSIITSQTKGNVELLAFLALEQNSLPSVPCTI